MRAANREAEIAQILPRTEIKIVVRTSKDVRSNVLNRLLQRERRYIPEAEIS